MSIKKHVLTYNREMPFKYEECAPGLSQCSTLKIHMQSHTWENLYLSEVLKGAFQSVLD